MPTISRTSKAPAIHAIRTPAEIKPRRRGGRQPVKGATHPTPARCPAGGAAVRVKHALPAPTLWRESWGWGGALAREGPKTRRGPDTRRVSGPRAISRPVTSGNSLLVIACSPVGEAPRAACERRPRRQHRLRQVPPPGGFRSCLRFDRGPYDDSPGPVPDPGR